MYESYYKWIDYKGKRILSVDYGKINTKQLAEFCDELLDIVTKQAPGSVLQLTDFSGFQFSAVAAGIFNRNTGKTKMYDKGIAVLGATGMLKVIYNSFSKIFSKPIKLFESRDEALDWLSSL
jgi:hypothetical protein